MAMLGGSTAPMPVVVAKKKPECDGLILFLNVMGLLAFLIGGLLFYISKSAAHEIEAGLALLCCIVALTGAGILTQIRALRD